MPSRWMAPESGSWSVAMVRMRELLPAPLGPRRPNIPLPTVRDTFLSARTPLGYVFERSVIVRATVHRSELKGTDGDMVRRREQRHRGCSCTTCAWELLRLGEGFLAWGEGFLALGNTD